MSDLGSETDSSNIAPGSGSGAAPSGTGGGGAAAGDGGAASGGAGSAGRGGSGGAVRTAGKFRKAPRQTLAGRVWVGLVAAAILLVLVIIFIAENTKSISINFLGAHGHLSEALALLLAVVVGVAITLLVGSARIIQLSLQVRKERTKLRDEMRKI